MPFCPNYMQYLVLNLAVSAALTELKVKFRYSIMVALDVEGVRLKPNLHCCQRKM